jgi:alpha/beta hydrolase family protein
VLAFVLIHSPFVGPLSWQPTARALEARGQIAAAPSLAASAARAPYWSRFADVVATAARELPEQAPLVLVGHSAAGLVLPAAGVAIRAAGPERAVRAYVFVDATLPRGSASLGELIPPEVGIGLEELRALAGGSGLLPPWGTDWPEDLWTQLIPDAALRARFAAELRPAPLALFEERPPAVPGWPDAPCAYLRFSPLYAREQDAARRAGWPTRALGGGHLHMLAASVAVASALLQLAADAQRAAGTAPRPAV